MSKDLVGKGKKDSSRRKTPPARTPEAQEQRMINLSMRQAEQMLEEGRAPAQIVVHFLKLATEKAKYETERVKAETQMLVSKANLMDSQQNSDELCMQVIEALKRYGGTSSDDDEYYDD